MTLRTWVAGWLLALLPMGVTGQESAPPAQREGSLTQAQEFFKSGAWSRAEEELHRCLQTEPTSVTANYLLARTLFHENKPQASLGAFTVAAKLSNPDATDLRIVALDYVLLHDYDDADHWARQSLQQDPRDGETWYTLGRIRYTENRFTDAAACFGKALALMPRSVKAENNLGLTQEALNEPDQAIASYRRALAWQVEVSAPSAEPMINLGILLTDRNQLDEARLLLERAETVDPSDTRVHSALGRLYARRNELPAAQSELQKAVTADPNNSGLHFQLGQVLRKEGFDEQAKVELQQAAALEKAGRK